MAQQMENSADAHRGGQSTTVVPPASPAPHATSSSEPTHNLRSQFWSVTKVVGPAFVAVAALVISLLSYTDQHQADQMAQQMEASADARLVSAWITMEANGVEIQNRSPDPVYNVAIWLGTTYSPRKPAVSLYLGEFPPCSETSVTMQLIQLDTGKYVGPSMSINDITYVAFTDVNNVNWVRTMSGNILGHPNGSLGDSTSRVRLPFTPVAGCP